jgi:hypothetical protein
LAELIVELHGFLRQTVDIRSHDVSVSVASVAAANIMTDDEKNVERFR